MFFIAEILKESWHLLLDSSIYIIFGLIVAGLLGVFLRPETVARHLTRGRVSSVVKAALIGVPIPL